MRKAEHITQLFVLGNGYTVVCESKNTRNGFKHEALMYSENGYFVDSDNCYYLNRTWESFRYESVLNKICNSVFGKTYEEMKRA